MIESFIHIDQDIFLFLNGLHTPLMDKVMLFITNKYTWIPAYLFLIAYLIKRYKKTAIPILIALILSVVLSDYVASGWAKPTFKRPRPSHEVSLKGQVHNIGSKGKEYGFFSSHASTSAAIGMFLILLFRKVTTKIFWILGWVLLYGYSRIYTGVHYPGDLFFGYLTGAIISIGIFYLLKKFLQHRKSQVVLQDF